MKPIRFATQNPLGSTSVTPPRQVSTKRPSLTVLATMSALLFAPALTPRAHAQTATQTLSGNITLDGWLGTYSGATIGNLTFTLADKNSPRFLIKTVPYQSGGAFSFTVPQGNYDVAVKAGRFLQSAKTANLTSADVSNFALQLEPGDIDGNNIDDVDDLTAVLLVFNTNVNDEAGSYDPNADLDGDGKVDVDDLTALLLQFNTSGAPTPAPRQNWHLSNLTLSKTGVVGSATLTGTVTLASPAPAGGTTVTLTSSLDYYATFSSTTLLDVTSQVITIPAGAMQSSTFTIYVTNTWYDGEFDHPLTDTATATIAASAYGWTQSAQVTVAANGTNLTIQNLTAIPANGAVAMAWNQLPEGTVSGYNVYRVGTATKLNSSPLPSAVYVDNGRPNGTSAQYQVTIVKLDGTETSRTATGASASATPTTAAPIMTWQNAPTGTITDSIDLYAMPNGNTLPGGYVLVDGKNVGGFNIPEVGNPYPGAVQVQIDTSELSNGNHTVQIMGADTQVAYISPVLTITVNNATSNSSLGGIVVTSERMTMPISATLPTGTASWTATLSSNGATVRSWSGTGNSPNLSWDKTDGADNEVEDGAYSLSVTSYSQPNFTSPIVPSIYAVYNKIGASPTHLSLVDYTYLKYDLSNKQTRRIRDSIQSVYNKLKKSNSSVSGLALTPDSKLATKLEEAELKKWLTNSVNYFHLETHGFYAVRPVNGPALYATWGRFSFYPKGAPNDGFGAVESPTHIRIDQLNRGEFAFAFMDFCGSAGNANISPQRISDATWANAFRIGLVDPQQDNGTFVGWNGDCTTMTKLNGTAVSLWYDWRVGFFNDMAPGIDFYHAYLAGNTQVSRTGKPQEDINPTDILNGTPRFTIIGNPNGTILR